MAFITINYMYSHCMQLSQSNSCFQTVAGPSSTLCLHGSQSAHHKTGFQHNHSLMTAGNQVYWPEFPGILGINRLMTNLHLISHVPRERGGELLTTYTGTRTM